MKNTIKDEQHKVTKAMESVTSKLPSDLFLWTALGAFAASAVLHATNQKKIGSFIGQWVVPLLLFGVYKKVVKQEGHDILEKKIQPLKNKVAEKVSHAKAHHSHN